MKPKNKKANALLEPEDEDSQLFKELLLPQSQSLENLVQEVKTVKPEPGFCVKTRDREENKIFLNVCHSAALPAPKDISEEELTHILSTDEVVNLRVPLSLGDAREELDKSGNPCIAHDIVINSDFYKKVEASSLFKNFVIQVAIQGLEDKCNKELNKDFTLLKNKKYLGTPSEVTVRTNSSKPMITELDSQDSFNANKSTATKKLMIQELESPDKPNITKTPQPTYTIVQDPAVGYPTHLVAEFQLPEVSRAKLINLDIGEDRIVLEAHPKKYFLDIFLPYPLEQDECGAQFNTDEKILTLTMKVASSKM